MHFDYNENELECKDILCYNHLYEKRRNKTDNNKKDRAQTDIHIKDRPETAGGIQSRVPKKEGTVKKDIIKKDEAGRITERAIKALQRFWDGSVSHAGA
jgi:hypothetical protein